MIQQFVRMMLHPDFRPGRRQATTYDEDVGTHEVKRSARKFRFDTPYDEAVPQPHTRLGSFAVLQSNRFMSQNPAG
jgi:hypothetical protein